VVTIWLVPVLALVAGGVVVVALLRQAASAASELVEEVGRWSEVTAAVAAVGAAARAGDPPSRPDRSR
jgi:cytochrome c-type biogenesis protein CcmH/NrfF